MKLKGFFLDVYETDESFETDNEALAWAKFYACQFGCLLFKNGKLIADKEFVEDDTNDEIILSAEVYNPSKDKEYAEL